MPGNLIDRASAVRDAMRALERELFGWALPPIDIALRETPLAGDPPAAWCLRCGQSVGLGEATARGCASCRGQPTALTATVRVAAYGGGLSRRLLQVKHARWHAMGEAIGERLAAQVEQSLPVATRPRVLVPVPMPWLRRWQRGIDHAHLLATAAGARLGVPVWQPLRQRNGPSQVSRTRTERQQATGRIELAQRTPRMKSGPFGLFRRDLPANQLEVVGLVDDVRTTGATLEQAARCLRRLGAGSVVGLVAAVVPNPRRRIAEPQGAGAGGERAVGGLWKTSE